MRERSVLFPTAVSCWSSIAPVVNKWNMSIVYSRNNNDGKCLEKKLSHCHFPLHSIQIPHGLVWFLTQATALRLTTVKGTCRPWLYQ
jgi:hypothetical protein